MLIIRTKKIKKCAVINNHVRLHNTTKNIEHKINLIKQISIIGFDFERHGNTNLILNFR